MGVWLRDGVRGAAVKGLEGRPVCRGRAALCVSLVEQRKNDGGPKNDADPHKTEDCNSLPPAGWFPDVTKQQGGLVHSTRIPGVNKDSAHARGSFGAIPAGTDRPTKCARDGRSAADVPA
jgi:hypothetical protein